MSEARIQTTMRSVSALFDAKLQSVIAKEPDNYSVLCWGPTPLARRVYPWWVKAPIATAGACRFLALDILATTRSKPYTLPEAADM
jgi:hypothetical protein